MLERFEKHTEKPRQHWTRRGELSRKEYNIMVGLIEAALGGLQGSAQGGM